MPRIRVFLFCLLPLLAAPVFLAAQAPAPAVHSAYGEKLHFSGVHNAGSVDGHLYRGGQPTSEGLDQLKQLGVATIVDLRGERSGVRDWERQQAEQRGMRFISIPVSGWHPPSDEQVAQFLSVLRDHPDEKVFVHCLYGDDRTGVFVATYRMAWNHWPPRQALDEMYFFGFHGLWHPAMKSFVRGFPEQLNDSPSLAAFRPSAAPK